MKPNSLILQLFNDSILTRSSRGYALRTRLFNKWLKHEGLSFSTFMETPPSEKAGSGKSLQTKDMKNTHGENELESRGGVSGVPSLSTLKNWRAGKSVSLKNVHVILRMMEYHDPDLKGLREAMQVEPKNLLSETHVKNLQGYWEEFHFSRQLGEPTITKGILCIISQTECFYTAYEPSVMTGEALRYHGDIELESGCMVFRLESDINGLKEKMALRYPFSGLGSVLKKMEGLCSGITFDQRPLASTTVLRRRVDLGKPSFKRTSLPAGKVRICNDAEAIRAIGNSGDFFEYGPSFSLFHPKWHDDRIGQAISEMEEDETVDIIAPYISDVDGFYSFVRNLADDKTCLRKFRCLFSHPDSAIFRIRFEAMTLEDHPEGSEVAQFQNAAWSHLEELQEYSAIGGSKKGVDFHVKHSYHFPMGFAFRVGRKVLFYGHLYATKTAVRGPMVEIRDPNSVAAKSFARDFDTLWGLSEDADLKERKRG